MVDATQAQRVFALQNVLDPAADNGFSLIIVILAAFVIILMMRKKKK